MAVTFDAYGDQATAGPRSYAYDALGRLTSDVATATGTGYTFSYAGSTGAIASDGAATYTWDPSGTTLAGVGAAAGGSGVLALTDSHGDVLGQFAPTGTAMAGSQAYDPWGNVTAATGSLSGLLGFQSAWTDPGTGKDLMGARWYSPSAGDFTSADTMQVPAVPDPAAADPFAYAADNPLGNTDPTGHWISIGSPETNSNYEADDAYAAVYVSTVQRVGVTVARAAATAAYTSTEKLVKKIVNPKPKPAKPANQPQDKQGASNRTGGALCGSVASRFAAGPCTIDMPTGPALPGGAAGFFAGLGGDLAGVLQTGVCLTNVIQCAAYQASGGPTLDSLYRSWLNRLGVDTNPDSTYKSGQIAGDILLLGTGGIGAAGDAADAATATEDAGAAGRLLAGATKVADMVDPAQIAGEVFPRR